MSGFEPQTLFSRCLAALEVLGIEGLLGTNQTLFQALLALQSLVRLLAASCRFGVTGRQHQDRIVGCDSRLVFFLFKVLGRTFQCFFSPVSQLKLTLCFKDQFLEERMICFQGESLACRFQTGLKLARLELALRVVQQARKPLLAIQPLLRFCLSRTASALCGLNCNAFSAVEGSLMLPAVQLAAARIEQFLKGAALVQDL
jgi:hypothetical protein